MSKERAKPGEVAETLGDAGFGQPEPEPEKKPPPKRKKKSEPTDDSEE